MSMYQYMTMSSVITWNMSENNKNHWIVCPSCDGMGNKLQKISKKAQRLYLRKCETYKHLGCIWEPPREPKGHRGVCLNCHGSGLLPSEYHTSPNTEDFPHVAIIGGGIGWVAFAVACFHRGIPFTLYERDVSFASRSQGYWLTLQQANKAMECFGIFWLQDEIRTTRHVVHDPEGKVIGEWGKKNTEKSNTVKPTKQKNVHIARQSLRSELLAQLNDSDSLRWGHKLVNLSQSENGGYELVFDVGGSIVTDNADLVVGADGIRSMVRKLLIGEDDAPLHYTGFIVILGICSLSDIASIQSDLLDSETVFQTVNGHERIYMMPYSSDAIMWQLSFPLREDEARKLSSEGADALKQEAIRRTPWHSPIPQILSATPSTKITGYPVYDREVLSVDHFKNVWNATLIGDAAHPMSPFKGQGANRALLDALALSREIYLWCKTGAQWRNEWIRKTVLEKYESQMIQHSAIKVRDSAEAGRLLHSDAVLHDGDTPRGRWITSHTRK